MENKIEVNLMVQPIEYGYIKGVMYSSTSEPFMFKGLIDPKKGLAHWMEAVDPKELEKQIAEATKSEVKEDSPVAEAAKAKPVTKAKPAKPVASVEV